MPFTVDSLPLPEKGVAHPAYITKVVSMKKICFRLIDHMEEYVHLFKNMQRYYAGRVTTFIDSVPEDSVKDHLFILNRQNLYHRVKVLQAWPDKTYYVQLIDEGFNCMASENDLILNSNEEYLTQPSHSFILALDIDKDFDKRMEYIINYGLQKVANTKTNFFITITHENKIQLHYKDRKNSRVSVNDFLVEFIKKASGLPHSKVSDAMKVHMEATENGTLAKLYRLKVETPRFVLPVEEGTIEGEKPLSMKCQQVFNPFEFYLKLEKDAKFKDFLGGMNDFYKDRKLEHADSINSKELYLTFFNEQPTRLLILNSFKEDYYSCLLFDKGIIGTINKSDIFELDNQFKHEPPRAVKASLAFIKPISEKWSREANEFFKKKVKGGRCSVYPISNGSNGILHCLLTKNDVNIGDSLIEFEFAEVAI